MRRYDDTLVNVKRAKNTYVANVDEYSKNENISTMREKKDNALPSR